VRDSLTGVTTRFNFVHFGHACVLVDTGSARLLFDPGTLSHGFEDVRDLDAILITHRHFDHLDMTRLPALLEANPQATLIADPGSADEELAKASIPATVAGPGDMIMIGTTTIDAVGGEHAMIHPDYPVPPNTGYVLNGGAFYHPGDSLFVPNGEIDVLGIPLSAPWMKTGEGIDFQRAIKPRVSFGIHDALLSDVGRNGTINWLTELAPKNTEVRLLPQREPTEV
jgi:L-ascorbate metabolism protein UlaG (beta-lactamase superfamily)